MPVGRCECLDHKHAQQSKHCHAVRTIHSPEAALGLATYRSPAQLQAQTELVLQLHAHAVTREGLLLGVGALLRMTQVLNPLPNYARPQSYSESSETSTLFLITWYLNLTPKYFTKSRTASSPQLALAARAVGLQTGHTRLVSR
jgi:hypothetical protein